MYECLTTNLKNNKKNLVEKKINYKKKNSKRRYKIDVNTNIKIRIYFLKLSLFNYYIQSQNY